LSHPRENSWRLNIVFLATILKCCDFVIRSISLLSYKLGSPFLVHLLIMACTCQPGICHLTLTSFSWSTDFLKLTYIFLVIMAVFICPSWDGPYYVIGYGGRVGVHTGFRTITLVLYIRSLPNLATWFPCGRGRTLFILGSKVKVTVTINRIFDNSRFRTITLVLYIGSWPHDCPFEEEESYLFWGQRSRSRTINIYFDNRVVSAR
jgi:hypothetical protein